MPVGHGSEAAKLLRWAVDDPETVRRYRAKVVAVPGSACAWWSGALSGRGHGRFWLGTVAGRDVVVIAHPVRVRPRARRRRVAGHTGAGARLRQPDLPTHRCRARAGI
jgi:hypothetical protein